DENSLELPAVDGDWIIEAATDEGLRIRGVQLPYVATLGYDHIHYFTSNPDRKDGGLQFGFLTLCVQIYLQGCALRVRPTLRPGESLPPPTVTITEKCVDFNYPTASGLQGRLNDLGFQIGWAQERNVAQRVEIDGWQIVTEPDGHGNLTSYRVKDRPHDLILLRRKIH
ncbi:MAG TPA: hypothetical protein VHX18_10685, partial [Rhizomicrobium sp.]|nr:hypothetical protein [Rhizomicrobium sp.]